MKLTIERFTAKFFDNIHNHYPDCHMDNGNLIINKGIHELELAVGQVYKDYLESNNFDSIFKAYLTTICESLNNVVMQGNPIISYYNIYPILKNKDFMDSDNRLFLRRPYFLDLEVLYVDHDPNVFNMLLVDKNKDDTKVYNAAMFNINKIKNELVLLNPQLDIYTTKYETEYSSSLIFSPLFRKQITKKMGKTFLVAFSSASSILIANNFSYNIEIMKDLMSVDEDTNKISSHIYRISGEKWEYAYE